MTIKNYNVLKAKIIDGSFKGGKHEHYIINVQDSEKKYQAFVNVLSSDKSFLEYVLNPNWKNPLQDKLRELELGLHNIPSQPDGIAIDYIRSGVVNAKLFNGVPIDISISDNNLVALIDHFVQDAQSEDDSLIYVFGSAFKDENEDGEELGIHDVHMNQGNPLDSNFKGDNGVYQDGALFFQYSNDEPWVSLFLKFRSQSMSTDDETGDPV